MSAVSSHPTVFVRCVSCCSAVCVLHTRHCEPVRQLGRIAKLNGSLVWSAQSTQAHVAGHDPVIPHARHVNTSWKSTGRLVADAAAMQIEDDHGDQSYGALARTSLQSLVGTSSRSSNMDVVFYNRHLHE